MSCTGSPSRYHRVHEGEPAVGSMRSYPESLDFASEYSYYSRGPTFHPTISLLVKMGEKLDEWHVFLCRRSLRIGI